jgi:hypothetical protein
MREEYVNTAKERSVVEKKNPERERKRPKKFD